MMNKAEKGAAWVTAADIAVDQYSDPIYMQGPTNGYSKVSLEAVVSGTATLVGPVYIQGSNSYNVPGATATWTTLEDSSGNPITAATLASGAGAYSDGGVTDISWSYIRFFFDRTSGTGTITGYVTLSV